MLLLPVIVGICLLALFYVLVPALLTGYTAARGVRTLACPDGGTQATVQPAALQMAVSEIGMNPKQPVASCSLWPGKQGCDGRCLR